MTKKVKEMLQSLKDSGSSSAIAVAEHIETVAGNGREYATNSAVREEACALREWAKMVQSAAED